MQRHMEKGVKNAFQLRFAWYHLFRISKTILRWHVNVTQSGSVLKVSHPVRHQSVSHKWWSELISNWTNGRDPYFYCWSDPVNRQRSLGVFGVTVSHWRPGVKLLYYVRIERERDKTFYQWPKNEDIQVGSRSWEGGREWRGWKKLIIIQEH